MKINDGIDVIDYPENIGNNDYINNKEVYNKIVYYFSIDKMYNQFILSFNDIKNNELKEKENTIRKLNEEISKLQSENKKLKNENFEFQNYIMNNKCNNLNENSIISSREGEKIISVLFMSQGSQDIFNYSMACKTTDLFVRLEERLYKDYPKFKDFEVTFKVNTSPIKRFKTIEENKIRNNDIISLYFFD